MNNKMGGGTCDLHWLLLPCLIPCGLLNHGEEIKESVHLWLLQSIIHVKSLAHTILILTDR